MTRCPHCDKPRDRAHDLLGCPHFTGQRRPLTQRQLEEQDRVERRFAERWWR